MIQVIDGLLVLVLLLNFFALGTTRVKSIINATAAQGVLLGAATLAVHWSLELELILVAVSAVALKGLVIPQLLRRALRNVSIRHEIEPFIDYVPSLLVGAVGTAFSILYASALPLAPQHVGTLLVPASLSTILTGLVLLATRRKAITQVVGYLILENGVFVMGLTLVDAMPLLVELGVLLDILVAIFVMGIIVNHIQREFASQDTTHVSQLRD